MSSDFQEFLRTPRTDAAERFFYESGRPPVGFVDSGVARSLEVELSQAVARLKQHGLEPPAPLDLRGRLRSPTGRRPAGSFFQAPGASPVAAAQPAAAPLITPPLQATAATEGLGEVRVYEDGEVLYRRGERAENVFIVLHGQVLLSEAEDASADRPLGVGQVIGEHAMFEEGVHAESIQSSGEVRCVMLPTATLRELLPADGSLLQTLMMALVLQYRMVCRIAERLAQGQPLVGYELLGQKSLTGPELHRALVEARTQAPGHGLSTSQRMCLQLQTSELMPTRLLRAGMDLGGPGQEHLGLGMMTVHGAAQLLIGEQAVQLGQGSVIGVAEGLTGRAFGWAYSAQEDINARVFPMDRALQRLERADPTVRALAAHLCERILALQSSSIAA